MRKKKTMDGNEACSYASYAYTDVAAIYPITPSSVMAEHTDEWATQGKQNIFGEKVVIRELQSEGGAAGVVHGSLSAGALTTTYTASQGLLLMIPNLYKIAGERLPGVFNVSARAVATHALSIFGDHSDVYACRETGSCMLCESSVQEIMDLTPVAHLSAIKGKLPFINFFDGFRSSHEIQKIEIWDDKDLKSMADMKAIDDFKKTALNPNHPEERGQAQNPDIFFQVREASNIAYDDMPKIVQQYMDVVNKKIGTNYKLFNYYGPKDAKHVIVAMGSVCETIEETIDYLSKNTKQKVGLIKVRLYRPFDVKAFLSCIPNTCKTISVLDRTKEPGSIGEPLYLDVVCALKNTKFDKVLINSGRYGLGSKDTTPEQIVAVYNNTTKKKFTIGINDDVTKLSLKCNKNINSIPEGTICCKFWGFGSDGTVGANKNSIKIIGDNTKLYTQAYFDYDSKKSGGVTVSHLRFGNSPIKSTYLISKANFVACHNTSYVNKYKMVEELVDGGTFLLNCGWNDDEIDKNLPDTMKSFIAKHKIKFYAIDGASIGIKTGMGPTRINTILQSAFFKLTNIIPYDKAVGYMKDAVRKTYGNKGEDVVNKNFDAIDCGGKEVRLVEIKPSWQKIKINQVKEKDVDGTKEQIKFVNLVQKAVNAKQGDSIPVSAFMDYSNGSTPSGTSQFEKRCANLTAPVWNKDNCIGCNFCAFACPHAAIRSFALNEDEIKKAPKDLSVKELVGMPQYKFTIATSVFDCTGCGVCVEICPGISGIKALTMQPIDKVKDNQKCFDYCNKLQDKDDVVMHFKESTVKGSQFKRPLLEFSGACAGCGETPYAKLITQLFGDRMYIANATGCSSIWGNSSPSTPYTFNQKKRGPVFNNSLFEDNAEFAYGMYLASNTIRNSLIDKLVLLSKDASGSLKKCIDEYLNTKDSSALNIIATDNLVLELKKSSNSIAREILKNKDYLSKKSVFAFGGDGWAYDIGYGGLDHVIASNEDVNIVVFDTEVYSNTGGQNSKATPTGAVAQFAAGGKEVKKKDLAQLAMSYGYVYVAQVSLGYNMAQTLKAFIEAESYNGPSLVIAYAPCINHGIKKGMGKSLLEEKLAVECGYWHTFRFNPMAENKLTIDSKEPNYDKYREFLQGEVRYNSLMIKNKERSEKLIEKNIAEAKNKYQHLKSLLSIYNKE